MTWQNQPTQPPVGLPPVRPAWARKRIIIPVIVGSWVIGAVMGAAGSGDSATAPKAAPAVTATATATATAEVTVTASAKPAATVTVRATRTVRATVTAKAAGGGSGGGGATYYANCAAVRAAGAAPIYRGDPGYSSSLDRDGDGVACE